MEITKWMLLGSALGVSYFAFQEASIPKETVCQYAASPLTDVITWIVGGIFTWRGYVNNDPIIATLGTAAAMVHVSQTLHYQWNKRKKELPGG